jgi:prolyl 4-hydroxylase
MAELDLRMRAGAGDAKAQLKLAQLILTGRERAASPDEVMRLLARACAQRDAEALLFHATLALRGFGRPQSFADAERLVGEAAARGDTRAKGQLLALGGRIDAAQWSAPAELVQHHQAPRIFTIRNFIPKSVCAWLVKYGRKHEERAVVWDAASDGSVKVDDNRTNSVAYTALLQPDIALQLVNLRIASVTGLPIAQQEPTNILHYARGQQYRPHFDFITPEEAAGMGPAFRALGQRVMTFLIYLNDDFAGGETAFPQLDWRFRGASGDALLWWNLTPGGEPEPLSLHAGLPVARGEKWLFSKWIRERLVPVR